MIKPIVAVNLDYLLPSSDAMSQLKAAGYEVVEMEGCNIPSIQVSPQLDRRFIAAALAMQGVVSRADTGAQSHPSEVPRNVALLALACADALLAELDKPA